MVKTFNSCTGIYQLNNDDLEQLKIEVNQVKTIAKDKELLREMSMF